MFSQLFGFYLINRRQIKQRNDSDCILNDWTHTVTHFAIQQPYLICELKGVKWLIIMNEWKESFSGEESQKLAYNANQMEPQQKDLFIYYLKNI